MKIKHLLVIILFACVFGPIYAQNVTPVLKDGKYNFQIANVYFEVDPLYGGRVSSLKIDTTEILYIKTIGQPNGSDNAGSTFWPSPQSVWNWPPPVELSYNKYTVESTDGKLILRSSLNAKTGLSFTKIYSVNLADTSITIQYYMKNWLAKAKSWAPWEITRVNANGLTFFAVGSGKATGTMAANVKILGNNAWYCQDSTIVPAGIAKFNCDGKGWLAHKTLSRYLLIKTFQNISVSQFASGEAEIECYTSADHVYTELEDQGAYTSIASGDSLKWQVKWYARKLPDGIQGLSGEQKLVNYVNEIMNSDSIYNNIDVVKHSGTEIRLYPNPAKNIITIEGLDKPAVLSILSINGQKILNQKLMPGTKIVDLPNVPDGIYMYQVKIENYEYNGKFIIKK
jgi:hypothetical protein